MNNNIKNINPLICGQYFSMVSLNTILIWATLKLDAYK